MTILRPPLGLLDVLKAGTERYFGVIELTKVRTVSITVRVTYHASATSSVRCNLYFGPDKENFDTVPYTYFDVDLTAGATVQETKIIDCPEEGFLVISVKNLDTTYDATNVRVWYTFSVWG